ncbi:hypothetical protein [Streptomyces sp. NPDC058620]
MTTDKQFKRAAQELAECEGISCTAAGDASPPPRNPSSAIG